jgi:hypothetical protein
VRKAVFDLRCVKVGCVASLDVTQHNGKHIAHNAEVCKSVKRDLEVDLLRGKRDLLTLAYLSACNSKTRSQC